MTATVSPSAIEGTLAAPASKSQTIRAIAAAMLADGQSVLLIPPTAMMRSRCWR